MASQQQPPSSNPFDVNPFATTTSPQNNQQQQQQQQWGAQQQQQLPPQQQPVANVNPFTAMSPPNQQQQNPFAPSQQQPIQQPVQYPPTQHNVAAAVPQYPPQSNQPQLQLQQHPHNTQQQQQQLQQQIVPSINATVSPWALQVDTGAANPVASPPAAAQPYDPLGIFNAQQQAPPPQQQIQQAYPGQQQQYNNYAINQPQQQPQPAAPVVQSPPNYNIERQNESLLPDEEDDEGLALIDVELDDDDDDVVANSSNLEDRKKDGDFLQADSIKKKKKKSSSSNGRNGSSSGQQYNSWDRNPDVAPPPPPTPGRHHAEYLSDNSAPSMSSPLPRYELVHHSGYVLSRISFRTVLLRKWKQTFWIQYGPTQLLFFRSYSDYVDWLNNPYHTMKAREYLVKLRVDFVSDLKKSSVMGYQVTQVRRKPYGKNVMLHFKLERWMDYGPTIAAAFAAREEEMLNSPSHNRNGGTANADGEMNTTNDVTALRKIILGCMRNARDAALVASRGQQRDMGIVSQDDGYRGRYHETGTNDHSSQNRETRIPSGSGNMGYHQAFSAESSQRRPMTSEGYETEPSEDEAAPPAPAAPVVDLLG